VAGNRQGLSSHTHIPFLEVHNLLQAVCMDGDELHLVLVAEDLDGDDPRALLPWVLVCRDDCLPKRLDAVLHEAEGSKLSGAHAV
jgi:hypothetical protein